MNDQPFFIGTSQGIINRNAITCILPADKFHLEHDGAEMGIEIHLQHDGGFICLYDEEAERFLKGLGIYGTVTEKQFIENLKKRGNNNA